mmetsp:Transcript_28595/g.52473  ORF Transcript_28595/g.52473 Transcript_28595/m.52473 type:complete len:236 (-) Transcript_28595:279-986(-)
MLFTSSCSDFAEVYIAAAAFCFSRAAVNDSSAAWTAAALSCLPASPLLSTASNSAIRLETSSFNSLKHIKSNSPRSDGALCKAGFKAVIRLSSNSEAWRNLINPSIILPVFAPSTGFTLNGLIMSWTAASICCFFFSAFSNSASSRCCLALASLNALLATRKSWATAANSRMRCLVPSSFSSSFACSLMLSSFFAFSMFFALSTCSWNLTISYSRPCNALSRTLPITLTTSCWNG